MTWPFALILGVLAMLSFAAGFAIALWLAHNEVRCLRDRNTAQRRRLYELARDLDDARRMLHGDRE